MLVASVVGVRKNDSPPPLRSATLPPLDELGARLYSLPLYSNPASSRRMNDDDGFGGGLDLDSFVAIAGAPEAPNTTAPPVLVVSAKHGSLPSSAEDVARIRDVLSRSSGLQCLRFEASGERALAYFEDDDGAQKASAALTSGFPHLQARKAGATLQAAMIHMSYAATLLEDYLRATFEGFGDVLGVDLVQEHNVMLLHMAKTTMAESAYHALNGRADGAWLWRLSLNKVGAAAL